MNILTISANALQFLDILTVYNSTTTTRLNVIIYYTMIQIVYLGVPNEIINLIEAKASIHYCYNSNFYPPFKVGCLH